MNRRQRVVLAGIFTDPVPSDLRWSEIEGLLAALGAEVTEGNGSRVRIALNGVRAVFHRPHPRPVTTRAAVRAARDFLIAAGIRPAPEAQDA